ncbi:hypothetical protein PQQ72_31735 [Paraburkholderia strydomiana]|uniref:hypothetical protein n=1 Tax=Paraburkholderia strydomiana TaxID=1245417 RepID=UPI0038B7B714
MSDSVRTREAINKTREAVLAQQMHEVDNLTDKIVGVAERIERAAATIASAQQSPSAKPAIPRTSKSETPKPHETTWPSRWLRLGLIVAISAGIGAGIARLMPMQYGGQAADLALASAVKEQIAKEGGNGVMWRSLRPEVQNAALAAMGR